MLSSHVFFFFYYCFTKLIFTYIYFQFYILFATHFSSISKLPFEITFSLKDTLLDWQLPAMTQKTVHCGIHKSMSDHETLSHLLLASLTKREDFSQKIPVYICVSIFIHLLEHI